MASSYTPSLRLELMASGENRNLWGPKANTTYTLVDQAINGFISLVMPDANLTLSTANGSTDQARYAMIECTGTLTQPRSLIIPPVPKTYYIFNNTLGGYDITVTNGVTSTTVQNGKWAFVWTTSINVFKRSGFSVADYFWDPTGASAPIGPNSSTGPGAPNIPTLSPGNTYASYGYQILPTGLMLQWMNINQTATSKLWNYPRPFSAIPFHINASSPGPTTYNSGSPARPFEGVYVNRSLEIAPVTSFALNNTYTGAVARTIQVFAVGPA